MYIGLVLFFSSSVQNLTTQDCDGPIVCHIRLGTSLITKSKGGSSYIITDLVYTQTSKDVMIILKISIRRAKVARLTS